MRRPAVLTMSAVSAVVVLASLRSSDRGPLANAPIGAAAAGIVRSGAATTAVPSTTVPAPAAGTRRATAAAASPHRRTAASAPVSSPRAAPPKPVSRPAASTRPPARSAAPRPAQPTTTTVNGAPADTQYGPVQVQIRIRGHRIIGADAIDYPQGSSQDQQINSQAIPQLDQETINAQSSHIDTVSGATYTSEGYRQSLQSALDAAHQAGVW